jgi:hypothetical protein
MTTTRQRVAALVLATMIAAAGAFATSATFASDAHAIGNTGNVQTWDY